MNFTKIITIVLIIFVVVLIATSYLSFNKSDIKEETSDKIDSTFENIKDNNLINIPKTSFENIKSRIAFGSINREIPSEVYFCPEDNCLTELLKLIESSKKTIDCAVYDISLETITEKLIEKSNKEVNIRIVSDYERSKSKNSSIGVLKESNVSIITNPSDSSYMHNKFCVFDEKIVWIGSMNFTLNGNYTNNNNVLVIEDKELAKEYTKKVDSFFKGEFSPKINEEVVLKQYGNIENYFCPEDNCEYHLLKYLENSTSSLDCMFFSFTLNSVFDVIKDKPIDQRYILEKRNIDSYSQYNNLKNNSIPVILDENPNSMHNKFCIIDDYIVMTGSMNISNNGTKNNDEILIFVYDQEVANKYKNYFEKYWDLWSAN